MATAAVSKTAILQVRILPPLIKSLGVDNAEMNGALK